MAPDRANVYRVRATFRAPIKYVLNWCTDYSSKDAALEQDDFQRRVLQRSKNRVVYEDLYDTPSGWMWSHWTVTVHPPNLWHGESVGSHRRWSVDYRLKSLADGRTELTLTGRRTPMGVATKNPPKADLERGLTQTWRHFSKALDRDYRASERAGARRRAR